MCERKVGTTRGHLFLVHVRTMQLSTTTVNTIVTQKIIGAHLQIILNYGINKYLPNINNMN